MAPNAPPPVSLDGWEFDGRTVSERWGIDDAYGCMETLEILTLQDQPVILAAYRASPRWLLVYRLVFDDRSAAMTQTAHYRTPMSVCTDDDGFAGAIESFDVDLPAGARAEGVIRGDLASWVISGGGAAAVLASGRIGLAEVESLSREIAASLG